MDKKVNLYIVSKIEERNKQVRELILKGLVSAGVINDVKYITEELTNDLVDRVMENDEEVDYSVIVDMNGENYLDEEVENRLIENSQTEYERVRLWKYDSVIFPQFSLDLLMFLSKSLVGLLAE